MASDSILDHASEMLFTVLHDIVKHVKLQSSKNKRLSKIYPAFEKQQLVIYVQVAVMQFTIVTESLLF